MPQDFYRHGEAPRHMTGKVGRFASTRRDYIPARPSDEELKPTPNEESSSSSDSGQTSQVSSEKAAESETPSTPSEESGSGEASVIDKLKATSLSKWNDKDISKFLRAHDFSKKEIKEMSKAQRKAVVKQILKEG